MNPALTIRTAYRNIKDNRLRSALTILGLVIGIASVIILVGIGNGAANSVKDQVASLGADIVTVNISDSDSGLSQEETEGLEELSLVDSATPYQTLSASLSSGGEVSEQAGVVAAGEEYVSLMGYTIASGRDISKIDVDNYTKVCVIGSDVAEEFWGASDAVGHTIRIDGDSYTVIGVLESTGSSMGNNVDQMCLLPVTTAKYLGADSGVCSLYVKAVSEDSASEAAAQIESYLGRICGIGEDYYDVSTQSMMLDAMDDINNTLSLLLGGIAGISLLVGGIGVMNVMLVSVTERTREIGIRKSLGARRKDILVQFLMEALVLSIAGGVIGIVCGFTGGQIAVLAGASFAPGVQMVVLAFAVSVAVGLVFGILPARRAAGLRPVEALRYE
ncbi:MAG: ABC transporter permease [Firmicutes bacterium]|nr:ABC transporter permease [Bacillota bacterium]